jgi:hypothetical protein
MERIKSLVGGIGGPRSEVMSFTGPEPCEDCGATPADDLVGVRWLCRSCAPAARRAEREAETGPVGDPVPPSETPGTR